MDDDGVLRLLFALFSVDFIVVLWCVVWLEPGAWVGSRVL